MKETTRATYARAYTRPYQKMGTGKLKLNGNLFRSSPVQLPFNSRSPPVFFKRAPVVQIERGNFFFDAYHTSRLLQTVIRSFTAIVMASSRKEHNIYYTRASRATFTRSIITHSSRLMACLYYKANFQTTFRDVWSSPRKKEHQYG